MPGDRQSGPEPAESLPPEAASEQANAAAPSVPAPPPDDAGLGSMHTDNLREILHQLGISLFVTNYQGGKLIAVRPDKNTVNTHFLDFDKPMGLAVDRNRLFVGTQSGIREFRNVPDAAKRLVPPNRNDAVYVFRNYYVTGNVDVHEMTLGVNNECWFVNTRFSCLCTLDREHSFLPRWRPRFISKLAPEDRCHLNGLAMVNGQPRWVTALGDTDTAEGWRANKKNGGVLLDYETRDVDSARPGDAAQSALVPQSIVGAGIEPGDSGDRRPEERQSRDRCARSGIRARARFCRPARLHRIVAIARDQHIYGYRHRRATMPTAGVASGSSISKTERRSRF